MSFSGMPSDFATRALPEPGVLGWGPHLQLAVFPLGGSVHRLQRGMGQEGEGVGRLHDFSGALQGRVDVAIGADRGDGRGLQQGFGLLLEVVAALRLGRAVVPLDFERFARFLGVPPGVGHDSDAGLHARLGRGVGGGLDGAVDDQHLADSRHLLDLVDVRGFDFAGKDRALLDRRVKHAGQRDIDAEQRLAGDDRGGVDSLLGLANDAIVFRVLKGDAVEDRARERSGFGGELSVGGFFARGLVEDTAGIGGAFRCGDRPGDGSGGHQHLAAGRSYAAQRLPGFGSGRAAPGGLAAVGGLIEVGLFDAHVLPIDVELFGDEHGEYGLDALAHLGSPGLDGHGAVRGDFDKGGGLQVLLRGRLRLRLRDVEAEGEGAGGESGNFEKGAAVQVHWISPSP